MIAWLALRRRRGAAHFIQADGQEGLYTVFSRLSHKLKTSGEVIRGHLHGFADDLPDDVERWRVARRAITEEATGIDGLVNRLDLVVRLGMADQPLVMEPVNVAGLLEELMIDMAPSADNKGIVLGVSVSEAQDIPHISADPMALREVFSNLLENAIKHNDSGTEVTAEVKLSNDDLNIRIADDGKGMAADALEAIFDRGSRGYRPRAAKGTGMGLHLSKLLVELHGGEITARSSEGSGTEFHIELPVRRTS